MLLLNLNYEGNSVTIKIFINGFGRIGRLVFRAIAENHSSSDLDVVAINDLVPPDNLAYLLKYDSVHGKSGLNISSDENHLIVNGKKIRVFSEKNPKDLRLADLNVDFAIESTGRFTDANEAKKLLLAGAKRVLISAPAKGDNVGTYVIGVNETSKDAVILSNASCTTNCVAPVAAVMHAKFGIEKAMMTTVHSYTDDQNLQDGSHKDLRRARAAACNIVPTTTGAAIATTETIPDLKGIFDGMALRVPVATGSITDFTFLLKKDVTVEEVNNAFKEASTNPIYKDILAVSEGFLVSSDIIGRSESAIVDLPLTQVVAGNMVKVFAWYDNEWGYANRLVEQVIRVGRTLEGGIAPTDPLTLSHTNG